MKVLKGWAGWLAMALVLAGALLVAVSRDSGPRTQGERVDAIAKTIKCPTCRSESVYESQATASENIRTEIARQVAAGRTDDEVRSFLATRYGEDILLVPKGSGVTGLVWVLPVAALLVAIAGLAVVFARWRREAAASAGQVTDDDRALVAAALKASEPAGDGSP
ncbi:MAG TPA: cytochrome c-type biogenesis protein [Acidimicrobiales bacterium]